MNVSSRLYRWALALIALVTLGVAQAGETVTYFHNDAADSPLLATDANGFQAWKETYRPYGDRLVQSGASATNDVWFAGASVDETSGLSYMGARYYDATLGRFVAVDPLQINILDPQSLNRYAYANNNPFKFVDPSGESATAVLETVIVEGSKGFRLSPWGMFLNTLSWNSTASDDVIILNPGSSGRMYAEADADGAKSGTPKAVDDVVKELEEGAPIDDRGRSGSRKVDKTGTGASIKADWEKIVGASGKIPQSIPTQYGPGEYVELPGGGTASIRPGSSGGPATIEINRPGMKTWKGRYD